MYGTLATVYGLTNVWVIRVGFWWLENFPTYEKKEYNYWRNCKSVSLDSLLKKNPPGNYTQPHRLGEDPTCIFQGQNMLDQPDCLLWWDHCLGGKGSPWSYLCFFNILFSFVYSHKLVKMCFGWVDYQVPGKIAWTTRFTWFQWHLVYRDG